MGAVVVLACTTTAMITRAQAPADPRLRPMQLPTQVLDNAGTAWIVHGGGMVQQQGGNTPVFGQLGQLQVNGVSLVARGNVPAMMDERTGEILLENLSVGGVGVSRRILIDRGDGTVRFVDTFRNPAGGREQTLNVNYIVSLNFGLQQAQMVADPRRPQQTLGWAASVHGNRAAHLTWAGSRGRVMPRLIHAEGTNVLNVAFTLVVPPGKAVSLAHVHGTSPSLEHAIEQVSGPSREGRLLAGVPTDVRRTLVNVRQASPILPDELELLRGDLKGDVVELVNGDQLRGLVQTPRLSVRGGFGVVEVPAEKLLGVVALGRLRPVHLLVSREGEVFGGELLTDALVVALSSGQVVRVPASQVARVGMRMLEGEPEELRATAKPQVQLRSGERMAIASPTEPLQVATRYGVLKLPPQSVAEVLLVGENLPTHAVRLVDGSRLSGVLLAETLEVTLDGAAGSARLSLPVSGVRSVRPTPRGDDADEELGSPVDGRLVVLPDDVLRGTLAGVLELETGFEPVRVEGAQVRAVERAGESAVGGELRVTLWDGTVITGRPSRPGLTMRLSAGLELMVPVDLVGRYEHPAPRPSDFMAERVRGLVAELDAVEFRTREAAQRQLLAMGSAIVPLLRELQPSQPPEARQRIEQILAELSRP